MYGGGEAALLVLISIVSICVAVVPLRNINTEETIRTATDTVTAADEDWTIVNLGADWNENYNKLKTFNKTKRLRIVMQADCDWQGEGKLIMLGSNTGTEDDMYWVLDLNGHTLWLRVSICWYAEQFEITDSSEEKTGQIITDNWLQFYKYNGVHLFISGGTIDCNTLRVYTAKHSVSHLTVCGGKVNAKTILIDYDLSSDYGQPNAAGYFTVTSGSVVTKKVVYNRKNKYEDFNAVNVVRSENSICLTDNALVARVATWNENYHNYWYAVSTLEQVTGAYNYAYAVTWDISVVALADLVSSDQVYYLHYRPIPTETNPNPEWYQFTGLTITR